MSDINPSQLSPHCPVEQDIDTNELARSEAEVYESFPSPAVILEGGF